MMTVRTSIWVTLDTCLGVDFPIDVFWILSLASRKLPQSDALRHIGPRCSRDDTLPEWRCPESLHRPAEGHGDSLGQVDGTPVQMRPMRDTTDQEPSDSPHRIEVPDKPCLETCELEFPLYARSCVATQVSIRSIE